MSGLDVLCCVKQFQKTVIFTETTVKIRNFTINNDDNITISATADGGDCPPHVEGNSEFLEQTDLYGRQ
jgi:hypothetical protein